MQHKDLLNKIKLNGSIQISMVTFKHVKQQERKFEQYIIGFKISKNSRRCGLCFRTQSRAQIFFQRECSFVVKAIKWKVKSREGQVYFLHTGIS